MARAERDARRVLRQHWPDQQLPVDPVDVARSLGLRVFRADLPDDTWAMLVDDGVGLSIYLDRHQPESRYRLACALQIGHALSPDLPSMTGRALVHRHADPSHLHPSGAYARALADALLMPEPRVRCLSTEETRAPDLALAVVERMQVPLDAALRRVANLGLS